MDSMTSALPSRWSAILRQRCPKCKTGAVFFGQFAAHRRCPHCGLLFAREPGYFLGALYFGYGLGTLLLGALLFLAWMIWPELHLWQLLILALIGFLPFVPWVFRASRILWLHFDHFFDPAP